mmetsp:Transcript_56787/g.169561  ORF Transcript_56787/g.169561 Transcript_56787/m.169561 type:complete len:233 (+) Transcript_56787:211-909(+)
MTTPQSMLALGVIHVHFKYCRIPPSVPSHQAQLLPPVIPVCSRQVLHSELRRSTAQLRERPPQILPSIVADPLSAIPVPRLRRLAPRQAQHALEPRAEEGHVPQRAQQVAARLEGELLVRAGRVEEVHQPVLGRGRQDGRRRCAGARGRRRLESHPGDLLRVGVPVGSQGLLRRRPAQSASAASQIVKVDQAAGTPHGHQRSSVPDRVTQRLLGAGEAEFRRGGAQPAALRS